MEKKKRTVLEKTRNAVMVGAIVLMMAMMGASVAMVSLVKNAEAWSGSIEYDGDPWIQLSPGYNLVTPNCDPYFPNWNSEDPLMAHNWMENEYSIDDRYWIGGQHIIDTIWEGNCYQNPCYWHGASYQYDFSIKPMVAYFIYALEPCWIKAVGQIYPVMWVDMDAGYNWVGAVGEDSFWYAPGSTWHGAADLQFAIYDLYEEQYDIDNGLSIAAWWNNYDYDGYAYHNYYPDPPFEEPPEGGGEGDPIYGYGETTWTASSPTWQNFQVGRYTLANYSDWGIQDHMGFRIWVSEPCEFVFWPSNNPSGPASQQWWASQLTVFGNSYPFSEIWVDNIYRGMFDVDVELGCGPHVIWSRYDTPVWGNCTINAGEWEIVWWP
jgi:hypothetical protein